MSKLDIASIFVNYPEVVPVAKLSQKSYTAFLGNNIFFNAKQSFDPNGDNLNYSWSLGDGTGVNNSTFDSLNHVYSSKGIFNISVTVTDTNGNSDTDTAIANVYDYEVLVPTMSLLL